MLGGGGHCKSVLDALLRMDKYTEIVITDPFLKPGSVIMGCKVIGNDEVLPKLRESGFTDAFITLGSLTDTRIRRNLSDRIDDLSFSIPVIADPTAVISDYSQIGEGTFLGKNSVINADAKIGRHCIINTGAILEHECEVGDFCHISVGTILCGNVHVGNDSFIGSGTTVIQGISVGHDAVVGANSTVLRSVEDGRTVYGIVKTSDQEATI